MCLSISFIALVSTGVPVLLGTARLAAKSQQLTTNLIINACSIKYELLPKLSIILRQLFTSNMYSTMQSDTVCFVAQQIKLFPASTVWWPPGW